MAAAKKQAARAAKKPAARPAARREPTPAAVLKKVAAVSDTNKALQKEIKVMARVFGENQKVLVSMKNMIDALAGTLEHVQRQSRQISIIEEDTQKLFDGLAQARGQAGLVSRINEQTARLQGEIAKMAELQKASKSQELARQVRDSMDSIKNNSQMIIKIAQRIDEVRDDLRAVSGKADSVLGVGAEIDKLKASVDEIAGRTDRLGADTQVIESLRQELGKVIDGVSKSSSVGSELEAIKVAIDAVSSKAARIDQLGIVIDGLKKQFEAVSEKAGGGAAHAEEAAGRLAAKIDRIESELAALSAKAGQAAEAGEGLKSVREELGGLKRDVAERTGRLFDEIKAVGSAASRASDGSSREVMALLKLAEYQSGIRMGAESKYGDARDLEGMAKKTAEIAKVFESLDDGAGGRIPLPGEVRQWAVSKMLDCADRWELRFADAYSALANALGRDTLKDSIRVRQVRDIYGIRAVDELRADLGIS